MHTFRKEERLSSKKLIKQLLSEGSSFLIYPFRVSHFPAPLTNSAYPAQLLISVPKRRFKRAVDRNLIKRRIREVYRINKTNHLYKHLSSNGISLCIMLNYVANEILSSKSIEKKLILILNRLQQEYDKKGS